MAENIELKVRCSAYELAVVRERLAEQPTQPMASMRQTDTYFRVARGRLKLRMVETGNSGDIAELIQYQRADVAGARTSSYRRVEIALHAAPELKLALSDALGVITTVRKRRSVAVWRSTRVHLDEVDELGYFAELETVLGNDLTAETGQAEFDEVVEWLGLASLESIPGSYSDLMIMEGLHS